MRRGARDGVKRRQNGNIMGERNKREMERHRCGRRARNPGRAGERES